ncbi:MAG: replicative DNA helicase [Myxococcota bacterium]|nr:replicative DNA helicase [Myxococcota bacterium]
MESSVIQLEAGQERQGRIPPQDLNAERSVLGAMMLEVGAVSDAIGGLKADHFYRPAHAKVFEAMRALYDRSEPIDEITLQARLKENGSLEEVGGVSFLASLSDGVPSAANIAHYAKIVRERALIRRLIATTSSIATKGYEGTTDIEQLLDDAEVSIFEITSDRDQRSFSSMNELVKEAFKAIEKRFEEKSSITGVPTGFSEFDKMTAGLQPSDLIIVAGRPSMGKTALALNMAQSAAVEQGKSVAVFSLEMAKQQLVMRMLCSQARIDASRMRGGFLKDSDWPKLAKAAGQLSQAPIYIDDTGAISILEMRAKCRRLQADKGLDLIMVDYLQLMRGSSSSDGSREREISEISRGLKALARELSVPVIALSQLNRSLEQRQDKRPMLSDLRESGAIEQDADVITFVYRDEYYNPESEDKGLAEIIIGKQRNGATGTVKLTFLKQFTLFADLQREAA